VATVLPGSISSAFGASVGGLFLAFPAIFCARATLIEKHEIRCKRESGLSGRRRGQEAAALDAAGAVLGAVGMLVFAIVFRTLIDRSVLGAFVGASLAWIVLSVTAWFERRNFCFLRRSQYNQSDACRGATFGNKDSSPSRRSFLNGPHH
jgi:FtsH-binding integral membrane protein